MPATIYILYSAITDKYYIGATSEDIALRVDRHNSDYYQNKYTITGKPWELYYFINVEKMDVALSIEKHIKKMKSRIYIENLKKYPEMAVGLKKKYTTVDS